MITENTSPFCLSPAPLGTEMGCTAQSWFLGERWGRPGPWGGSPGEVGCPGSSLPSGGASSKLSPVMGCGDGTVLGSLCFHQGRRRGHGGTQTQNRKTRKPEATSVNSRPVHCHSLAWSQHWPPRCFRPEANVPLHQEPPIRAVQASFAFHLNEQGELSRDSRPLTPDP